MKRIIVSELKIDFDLLNNAIVFFRVMNIRKISIPICWQGEVLPDNYDPDFVPTCNVIVYLLRNLEKNFKLNNNKLSLVELEVIYHLLVFIEVNIKEFKYAFEHVDIDVSQICKVQEEITKIIESAKKFHIDYEKYDNEYNFDFDNFTDNDYKCVKLINTK